MNNRMSEFLYIESKYTASTSICYVCVVLEKDLRQNLDNLYLF